MPSLTGSTGSLKGFASFLARSFLLRMLPMSLNRASILLSASVTAEGCGLRRLLSGAPASPKGLLPGTAPGPAAPAVPLAPAGAAGSSRGGA